MTDLPRFERALHQILWELREYLPDLVIIGGWVPHLYRKYGGFRTWTLEMPFTTEVDLLVRPPLPLSGAETIPEILKRSGFEPRSRGRSVAVWTREVEAGEKVEFLTTHTGTAQQRGQIVPVANQEGLGAVALVGLDILHRHRTSLTVPLGTFEGAIRLAKVSLPRLGAFAINKAITFPYRTPRAAETANPKRGKDLLYLRDLMAAGEEVITYIEDDLRKIARSDPSAERAIRKAHSNIGLALDGALQGALAEVTEAVSVGFGLGAEAALADVRGHLGDFRMILRDALNRAQ